MKEKILLLGIGLLAGVTAVLLLTNKQKAPVEQPDAAPAQAAHEVTPPTPVEKEPTPVVRPQLVSVTPVTTVPVQSAWEKLSEKYGPEKTALASRITSNLTSVIRDGMELANTMAKNNGSASLGEAASKELLRNAASKLSLSEAQQQQAAGVIQAAVDKRVQAVEELTHAMGAEPERLMGVMLAGDALAQNQISKAEYDSLTLPTRQMLQQVTGFVTGRAGTDPASLLDPQTTAELNAILTPEQQTKLAEMTTAWTQKVQARQEAQSKQGMGFQPGEIPVMDLGRLDQTVSSVKQMAEAGRLMMEAMKGLKEANPPPATQ